MTMSKVHPNPQVIAEALTDYYNAEISFVELGELLISECLTLSRLLALRVDYENGQPIMKRLTDLNNNNIALVYLDIRTGTGMIDLPLVLNTLSSQS